MWLSRTRVCSAIATSASGRRRRQTDVIKLLYGKKWDKLAAQPTSSARPTLTHTIDQTPQHHLYSAIRHAVAMKEVNRETIHELLQRQRRLKRWDRSEIIVQALHDAQIQFTSQDYVILISHANDSNNTAEAMKYWQHAVHANKVNPQVHSALLATYRNAGNWQAALQHCHEMWEDKIVLDTFGLHATMNGCRRHGAWQEAINIFHEAIQHGTRPNAVVYLELLRSFEAATEMPLRWKYGEAILNALHVHNLNLQAQTQSSESTNLTNEKNTESSNSSKEVIELTAGHYNAVMSMFIHSPQWERGITLFSQMQKYNIQPSKDTLTTLLKLHEHDLSHCIRCVALAHQLSMPVTEKMYSALLRNLFARRLDHEAAAFIRKELQTDTQQTGNPLTVSLTLGLALLDALLIHPCGQDALIFYESFEELINSVLAGSTRHLVSIGDRSQRWLIHGRVAVVDHTVLLSTLFESLLQHYDSVFISCTSIRLILRRVMEDKKSMWSVNALQSLHRLSRLLPSPGWQMVRVLPYTHQLQAHTYLESTLPVDTHALEELRHEASSTINKANVLNSISCNAGEVDGIAEATSSWEQRLLDRFDHVNNSNSSSGSNDEVKPVSIVIRSHNTITAMLDENNKELETTHSTSQVNHHLHSKDDDDDESLALTQQIIPSPVEQTSMKKFSDRITSIESVLAVAAMLKTLNSDAADVHLVSRNAKQLSCVAE